MKKVKKTKPKTVTLKLEVDGYEYNAGDYCISHKHTFYDDIRGGPRLVTTPKAIVDNIIQPIKDFVSSNGDCKCTIQISLSKNKNRSRGK